jgi:inner membrane protein
MNNAIYWIVLSALLLITELLSGSGFILCFGIAAFMVSILPLAFPVLSLSMQLIIFAVLAVLGALCWKFILEHRRSQTSDKSFLNKRVEQYIGQKFTLQSAITNGTGRISIGDTIWQVRCNKNLPIGASVIVVGVEGAVLLVDFIE